MLRNLAPPGTAPAPATVDGVPVKRLALGAVDIDYGTVGDRLVVTDSAGEIRRLHEGGGRSLADDETFRAARDAAQLPDRTSGWLYVDLRRGLALVDGLADLGGEKVPPGVRTNLTALESALVYTTRDGPATTIGAFVATR